MRNYYSGCCEGEPIVGRIVYGEKFPFGVVSKETYTADISKITADISTMRENLTTVSINVSNMTKRIDDVSSEMVRANNAIDSLRDSSSRDAAEIAAIKASLQDVKAECANNSATINNLTNRISSIELGMSNLRNQQLTMNENLNERIDSVSNNMSIIRETVQTVQRDLNELSVDTASRIASLNQRIENMEGEDSVEILNFIASPHTAERGSTVNVTLNWSIKGNAALTTVNGEAVAGTVMTDANVTTDKEYTIAVTDKKGITSVKKASVSFINNIYWGAHSGSDISAGLVKSLSNSELSGKKSRTISVSPKAEYVYYAYPKRLGTSTFTVGPLTGGFEEPVTVVISNSSGYAEDYYVYKSVQGTLDGNINITVD